MHSSSFDTENVGRDGGEVLVAITTLVTEGRIPGKLNSKTKGFYEGPHCILNKNSKDHKCDLTDVLCSNYKCIREHKVLLNLWKKNIPLCIEVLLTCSCKEDLGLTSTESYDDGLLLEKWFLNINQRRSAESTVFNFTQLISAIRSQLYFSQLAAWLIVQDAERTTTTTTVPQLKITKRNIRYRLTIPGETFPSTKFTLTAQKHEFPVTDIGNGKLLKVSLLSLPRMPTKPKLICNKCENNIVIEKNNFYNNERRLTTTTTATITTLQSEITTTTTTATATAMETTPTTSTTTTATTTMFCTQKGKHYCDGEFEKIYNFINKGCFNTKLCQDSCTSSSNNSNRSTNGSGNSGSNNNSRLLEEATTSKILTNSEIRQHNVVNSHKYNDLNNLSSSLSKVSRTTTTTTNSATVTDKGKLLLDAIERSGQKSTNVMNENDNGLCDMSESDIYSIKNKNSNRESKLKNLYVNKICDSPIPHYYSTFPPSTATVPSSLTTPQPPPPPPPPPLPSSFFSQQQNKLIMTSRKTPARKLSFEDTKNDIPTQSQQMKFRKDLDNAANMVFHSRTGLPLTSSPAPIRRGKSCFDFDSSINSVSAIKSALFPTSFSTDDDSESDGSIVSPCSPEANNLDKRDLSPVKYRRKGHAANLLGSFEESVLNGRLEPVSTVHGFTAELGASGSFVPKHLVLPVTVFFYTLGDNDKVSSPYLGHINLGKKGYNVPKSGTVQVTLFNPLGTVVKMFVIMYDLNDMPPYSQTFIRQRTLYMPTNCTNEDLEWGPKWLRFLIHLRFMSSKSGKIYLHSDIRMIIFRKSDVDTATAHGVDMSYELRSFTHMPTNPRFSPRK